MHEQAINVKRKSSCYENHDGCLRALFLRLRQLPLEYRMLNVEGSVRIGMIPAEGSRPLS